jgi:hypothetical protein
VEHLYILKGESQSPWPDDIERSQWLEILRPLTAVKGLYICEDFVPCIASALQEIVWERVMEVLPALRVLFLETPPLESGFVREAIGRFVSARRLAGHYIVVSHWGSEDVWRDELWRDEFDD